MIFPLVIGFLTTVEPIFYILKLNASLPVWSETGNFNAFIAYNCVDSLLQLTNVWVFTLKFYEALAAISKVLSYEAK